MSQESHRRPTGERTGPRFEDHLTNELRVALEDLNEVSHVAGWCAKECARGGPELADCARICTDVAELAEFNERLIARDSMFGPVIADAFIQVATWALPELEAYRRRPHVEETIEAVNRALDSCTTLMGSSGGARASGPEWRGREVASRETSDWETGRPEMSRRGMGGREIGRREMGGHEVGRREMGGRETSDEPMAGRGMGGRESGRREMGGRESGRRETDDRRGRGRY